MGVTSDSHGVSFGLWGGTERRGKAINQSNLLFSIFFYPNFFFCNRDCDWNETLSLNGWRSQVSCLPGNFHSSSTCR